jgi:hypothetical protein
MNLRSQNKETRRKQNKETNREALIWVVVMLAAGAAFGIVLLLISLISHG